MINLIQRIKNFLNKKVIVSVKMASAPERIFFTNDLRYNRKYKTFYINPSEFPDGVLPKVIILKSSKTSIEKVFNRISKVEKLYRNEDYLETYSTYFIEIGK